MRSVLTSLPTDRLLLVPIVMKYKEAIFNEFQEPVTKFMYPRPAKENPEMGVWIKKSAHGKHYGREAMAGIKRWADQNLQYKYIRYPVAAENIASRKIAESLGGKVQKEYEKTMQSGRVYLMVEYWIPPFGMLFHI